MMSFQGSSSELDEIWNPPEMNEQLECSDHLNSIFFSLQLMNEKAQIITVIESS